MGISYFSQEVEYTVRKILSFCKLHEIEVQFYDIEDLEAEYDEEVIITYDTEIEISLPRTEDFHDPLSIKELNNLIENSINSELIDECKLLSPTYNLISISCDNTNIFDEKLFDYCLTQKWNGKNISIKFLKGLSSYNIKLTMENLYDKYNPPMEDEDLFIELASTEPLSIKEFGDILESFIYECAASLNLNIYVYPRPTTLMYWEDNDPKLPDIRLRPLMQGKGISEVLHIYNSCNQIHDAEYLILNYTKVIEYISQTVLRKEMLESISRKLYSPKTLTPDANYILELDRLFAEHRNNQKDNQAIKLTVSTCCDIMDIVVSAPNYLKRIKKLTLSSSREERANCLDDLASAISDTRNMIAHAKTNYNIKGKECPDDQLHDFADCLKVVASQTIRWFSMQHEDSRIV
jgi:hypothetical protein